MHTSDHTYARANADLSTLHPYQAAFVQRHRTHFQGQAGALGVRFPRITDGGSIDYGSDPNPSPSALAMGHLFKAPPADDRRVVGHPARKVAVFGLTGNPPTLSHQASVDWLLNKGWEVRVVVSMGHETKDSLRTYPIRSFMCGLEWPDLIWPIEERLWPRVGLPVFTYDILQACREEVGDNARIVAAIGPDIDPRKWLGYPEIMRAGFDFERLPPGKYRSTLVRDAVASGAGPDKWAHMVSSRTAAVILKHRLFTRDAQRIERPDLSYTS